MILLGIFTGIEILFFSLGFLTATSIVICYKLYEIYKLKWLSWTLLISGIFTILFGIAWSVSSVLEGVPRSGSMGMLFFGGLGLIFLAMARRFILKEGKLPEQPESDIENG